MYYVVRGVLQENRQELCAFLLTVLTVVLRSVVNYSLLSHQEQQQLMVTHSRMHARTHTRTPLPKQKLK